jgi:hypothetical protein
MTQRSTYDKQEKCKKQMSKILQFPKSVLPKNAKAAIKLETLMKNKQMFFNIILDNDRNWTDYEFTQQDIEVIAMFGEAMDLKPKVSARLNSKLADFIQKKILAFGLDELFDEEFKDD